MVCFVADIAVVIISFSLLLHSRCKPSTWINLLIAALALFVAIAMAVMIALAVMLTKRSDPTSFQSSKTFDLPLITSRLLFSQFDLIGVFCELYDGDHSFLASDGRLLAIRWKYHRLEQYLPESLLESTDCSVPGRKLWSGIGPFGVAVCLFQLSVHGFELPKLDHRSVSRRASIDSTSCFFN